MTNQCCSTAVVAQGGVAIANLRPNCTLIAAFEAGRLINRIHFHTTQAWLLGSCQQAEFVSAAYAELLLVVRRLTDDAEAREWLCNGIRGLMDGWKDWFESEEHSEFLFLIDEGIHSQRWDEARSEAEIQGAINNREVVRIVSSMLDQFAKLALHLGQFLDQAQHPLDVVEEIAARYSQQLAAATAEAPVGFNPFEDQHTFRTIDNIHLEELRATSRRPPLHFLQELQLRCNELHLEVESLAGLFMEYGALENESNRMDHDAIVTSVSNSLKSHTQGKTAELAVLDNPRVGDDGLLEERLDSFGPAAQSLATDQRQEPFVMTLRQAAIMQALDGKALKKEALALAVGCGDNWPQLYMTKPGGGLTELQCHNRVVSKPGVGYYRPDSPPPELVLAHVTKTQLAKLTRN